MSTSESDPVANEDESDENQDESDQNQDESDTHEIKIHADPVANEDKSDPVVNEDLLGQMESDLLIQDTNEDLASRMKLLEKMGIEDDSFEGIGDKLTAELDTLILLISLLMQRTGLVFTISICWPPWALETLKWMSALSLPFSFPTIDQQVSEDAFTIAIGLVPIVIFIRIGFLLVCSPEWTDLGDHQPTHVEHMRWTLAKDSIPVLVAIILLSVGFARNDDWTVVFGMFVLIPGVYMPVIHTTHWLQWQTLSTTFEQSKENNKRFWDAILIQEGWFFVYLYTSTYGTAFSSMLRKTQSESPFLFLSDGIAPIIFSVLAFFYGVIPPYLVFRIARERSYAARHGNLEWDVCKSKLLDEPPFEFSLNRFMGPYEMKYCWFRALLMLEITFISCTVILSPDDDFKLISATVVTTLFFIIFVYTRPYENTEEDITDIVTRVLVLVNLLGGLLIEFSPDLAATDIVDILIGGTILAGAIWNLYMIRPYEKINTIRQYILVRKITTEMRTWSLEVIQDASMVQKILDLKDIDWKYLTTNQLELMSKSHPDAVVKNLQHISTSWDFSDSGTLKAGGHAISAIVKGISSNTSIKSINMLGNNISIQDASKLKKVLMKSNNLFSLCGHKGTTKADYSHGRYGPGDATLIAADLSIGIGYKKWETLSLKGNDIENRGVIAISEALKSNDKLTELDLTGRDSPNGVNDVPKHLGFKGAKALAGALKTNSVLKTLNVSNNFDQQDILDKSLKKLKKATKKFDTCEIIFDTDTEAGERRLKQLKEEAAEGSWFNCKYCILFIFVVVGFGIMITITYLTQSASRPAENWITTCQNNNTTISQNWTTSQNLTTSPNWKTSQNWTTSSSSIASSSS